MMRKKLLTVAALGLIGLGACSTDPVAPNSFLTSDTIDYLADFEFSSAAVIDGAGIGGARLPDELQLTADQKAAIAALHDAFKAAHAKELEDLRKIEEQLHQLRRSGSREGAQALLEQARAIHEALSDDFADLQEAIWAIYTAEQKAWIESHKPKVCDRNAAPQLTDAQLAQIRSLKQAFEESVADELAAIKAAHDAARAARQAGKSAEEIRAILDGVKDEMEAVREAEKRLMDAIQNVLTPEQRAAWCVVRQHVAPGGPRGPGRP